MTKLKDAYHSFIAAGTLLSMDAAVAVAQTVDPAAPLDFLKDSRTKAASSNLNVSSVTSAGGSLAVIIAVACGVVGLSLAGISGYKLYQAVQDENSRQSTGASLGGVILGSALTIIGIIVGVTTTTVTN